MDYSLAADLDGCISAMNTRVVKQSFEGDIINCYIVVFSQGLQVQVTVATSEYFGVGVFHGIPL